MKKILIFLSFITECMTVNAQQPAYADYPVYTGADLGLIYSPANSRFRVWSPNAIRMQLDLYKDGINPPLSSYPLKKDKNGTWIIELKGNKKGMYYSFRAMIGNDWMNAVPDPYTKAVNVNGSRGMIVDLKETDPPGWKNDKCPAFADPTSAIIYELHVRDASMAMNSGIRNKGKYIGLMEKGTKNPEGLSTGLDHLKELGVTHIHLLPCFDFNSVDETKPDAPYNWGYDPLNYNVPEGSYSTNPYDGITRIKEFKELIQTFHRNGLRVVMDVVYNHTALTEASNFNQLVPGYYYRQTKEGKFSNATACGNETASERPMMRKFIMESMKYWVEEYHVDGFRVDLMGVHDIATMNDISKELHKIKPGILLYGEGWTAGPSPLPDSERAIKSNVAKLDRIAVFSDDIRDGIKGSVFDHADKGFVSGKPGMEESVKFGIVASCNHAQVDYTKVNYSKKPYASAPWQTITYCECHDNHVLWDKLAISAINAGEAERKEMHKLSLSIVLTSQGISFLHAGAEFLRSKKGVENSFESPDDINAIDWSLKSTNKDVFEYVKGLVSLRKKHPAFRMMTAKEISTAIRFRDKLPGSVIVYSIDGTVSGDHWKKILVCFNGSDSIQTVATGTDNWSIFIRDNQFVSQKIKNGELSLQPHSCSLLYIN